LPQPAEIRNCLKIPRPQFLLACPSPQLSGMRTAWSVPARALETVGSRSNSIYLATRPL